MKVNKDSFFKRAWHGNIKIWQAVVLVNILGFVCTMVVGAGLGLAFLWLREAQIININIVLLNSYILALLLLGFGIYSVTCLWRVAPNPKGVIKHGLTRFWTFLFGVYLLATVYRLVSI